MKKLVAGAVGVLPLSMLAATDIAGVVTDVTGYKDTAIVVGVAVLLFIVGRKVVRKLI